MTLVGSLIKLLPATSRNIVARNVSDTPWKRQYIRRYGYKDPFFKKPDTLPRLKSEDFLKRIPTYRPYEPWSENRKHFGQNDYIDILGDGSIHPVQLLTHMPLWLRGFQGNEFQMLLRMQKNRYYYRWTKPTKWKWINKRVLYLYKYLNRKTPTSS